jgi:hypothetical protein
MVFIDNCNSALLRSNALAQVITESSVDCRPLGQSKMVPLNTNAFIAVTGNDLQISEDLARRFIVSNLDAKCENPEQRRFDGDFKAVLTANRQKLQASLLTIWRWGRQNRLQPGIPLGTFEIWASWCRDPLMALGCLDPVQRIADLKADDPMRQGIAEIFQTWFDIHGSTLIKFRDLDPRVRCLLGKNRQSQVTALQRLENARTGGFLLKAVNAQGYWGKKKYSISQTPDAL